MGNKKKLEKKAILVARIRNRRAAATTAQADKEVEEEACTAQADKATEEKEVEEEAATAKAQAAPEDEDGGKKNI